MLAVFPGSIYSGYSGCCKASVSDVCTAGAACVLGVQCTGAAHHAHSTRSIWTDFREERTHSRIRDPAWTGFPVSY